MKTNAIGFFFGNIISIYHQVDNQAQVTKTTLDMLFLVTVAPLNIDFHNDYAR